MAEKDRTTRRCYAYCAVGAAATAWGALLLACSNGAGKGGKVFFGAMGLYAAGVALLAIRRLFSRPR